MLPHRLRSAEAAQALCSTSYSADPCCALRPHMRSPASLGRMPFGRAWRLACNSAQVLEREFSAQTTVPAREFPGSFTNLDGTRGVLRLSGSEVLPFLQGLITNDVSPLEKPDAAPLYAALLNAQGRHLFDMFLHRTQGDKPTLLLDVDAQSLSELKKKLTMYKLRSDVDIADVSDEFSIWTRFGAGRLPTEEWTSDPRLESLGQRTIRGKRDKPSAPDGEVESTPLEYLRWRVQQGVAEGNAEIPTGHAMPLEYNLDQLNGISYSKGCYVGQELIARTHNRGVIRKRLMPVVIDGEEEAQLEIDSPVSPAGGGSEVGKIRLADGRTGLAHLRLKPALEAAEGRLELTSGSLKVTPFRPRWWPGEWGREEAESADAAA